MRNKTYTATNLEKQTSSQALGTAGFSEPFLTLPSRHNGVQILKKSEWVKTTLKKLLIHGRGEQI